MLAITHRSWLFRSEISGSIANYHLRDEQTAIFVISEFSVIYFHDCFRDFMTCCTYIELQDVTTMTYVDIDICSWRHVSIPRFNQIARYMYGWHMRLNNNLGFCCEFFMGRVRKWCGFNRDPRTHHRGCLANSEFRMAAWRTPSRGVDWTAPHPAINKLAEREQPRDEPFNSATFCLPSPFYVFSSPLAIVFSPPSSPCPLVRCSSAVVALAISDSARALLLCFATR